MIIINIIEVIVNLLNPIISGAASQSITDEELIQKYLDTQNTGYFDVLYSRYSAKVFGKCYSLLKSVERAEDATQDIFVKVLLNLSKFTGKSKFSTWLYSITYNFCIDIIRKKKKDLGVLVEDIGIYGDREYNDEIEDRKILETNVKRLKVILDILPSGDKAILLMKYQDEFSIKEICGILDKSESAVKMKIKRAKEKFMKIYKDKYKDAV